MAIPANPPESLGASIRPETGGRNAALAPKPRIDWKRGARLLVDGGQPAAVAAELGIDEERLWRQLRRSLRFRFYIRQQLERRRLMAQLHFTGLGPTAALRRSLEGDGSNFELLKWLSAEIGLADETAAQVAADRRKREANGEDVVSRLGETNAKPPNQALRRRLADDKTEMDAQMAVYAAELDVQQRQRALHQAKAAAKPAAASAEMAIPETGARRTQLDQIRPESDANRPELDSNRMKLDSNRPESDTKPDSNRPQLAPKRPDSDLNPPRSGGNDAEIDFDDLPPRPISRLRFEEAPPPTQPSRASLYRTIIDLPGPDWPPLDQRDAGEGTLPER